MPNYQLAKIYKIVDNRTGYTHIDTTCQSLEKRLLNHKTYHKKYSNGDNKYKYHSLNGIFEHGDYDMVLIENYPCNNKHELNARKSYHYKH
jgi:hypothetical protein